jgi:multiple sugar transport system ATP-binding protein
LMDEPLSNLDAKLRVETRANIAALQARLGTTTVYVTHDQVEAMTMGDRVAVLKDGVLQQCDESRNLYNLPRNAFVAGFIGSPAMNLRTVDLVAGGARLGNVVLPLRASVVQAAQEAGLSTITLGIRPESLSVATSGDAGLKLEVTLVEELGADAYVYGSLPGDGGDDKHFIVRFERQVPPRIGDVLLLNARAEEEHAFHPQTGERLG